MAVLDLIEFLDPTGEVIIFRQPQEDSGEFRLGSQLIVQESQEAIFFRDGQSLDAFGPGRHTLDTLNLPFLGRIIGMPFGGRSPFRAYVYFISRMTFTNLGWGTPNPIMFRDSEFRMISLRAHGAFSLRVRDSRVLLSTLVGTQGMTTTWAIEEYLRRFITAALAETISNKLKSILDLPHEYMNIGAELKAKVFHQVDQYGLELVDLIVEGITPPPEVQQMMNKATGIAAQDVSAYQAVAAADAMMEASKNPGAGGAGAGLGVGLGAGMSMAQQMVQNFAPKSVSPPSADAGERRSTGDLRTKVQELKSLMENGLMTAEDFEARKKILIDKYMGE